MQRVIVAYSDHVVMEPTLEESLSQIFGGPIPMASTPGAPPTAAPGTSPQAAPSAAQPAAQDVNSLIREANQHYQRAQQLLRQGDWNGYGDEIKKLGDVLKRMPVK